MEETFKLSPETFDRIVEFATNEDIENRKLVHSIIENSDINLSMPYIIMLYKEMNDSGYDKFLSDVFPKSADLKKYGVDRTLTYNSMYHILRMHGLLNSEAGDFFMKKFGIELSKYLKDWGFTFLDTYHINFIKNETE